MISTSRKSSQAGAIALLLLVTLVSAPREVAATDIWSHCFGSTCYDTLPEAVAAMRASIPHGGYLVEDETYVHRWSSGSESMARVYRVPPQPPANVLTPHYFQIGGHGVQEGACAPSDGPAGNVGCRSESVVASYAYQRMQASYPACSFTPYVMAGSYAYPFSYVNSNGLIVFDNISGSHRRIEYSIDCGGGPSFHNHWQIPSWSYYTCPTGMNGTTGYAEGQAPPGHTPIKYEEICWANDRPVIYSSVTQVPCESGSCHPTYPGTGDKARFESDFEFAGRPFVRNYHALLQTNPKEALAPGWSHTYSERLYPTSAKIYAFNDRGYHEGYTWVATQLYRSDSDPNKKLQQLSDRFRVIDGSGEVKEFNLSGRLLRIYRPGDPARKVELAYGGPGNLLLSVVDGQGRELLFDYSQGRLVTISLPGGSESSYAYDTHGNVSSVTRPDGSERGYLYGESGLSHPGQQHLLTGITDENGDRYASFGYDLRGRVTLSTLHTGDASHPTHDRTTLEYTTPTTVELTDGNGAVTEFNIRADAKRNTDSRVSPRGTVQFTYDSDGRRSGRVDEAGVASSYGYTSTYLQTVTEAIGSSVERRVVYERDAWQQQVSAVVQEKVSGTFVSRRITRVATDGAGSANAICELDPQSPSSTYTCGSLADAPGGVRQTRYARCDATDVSAPGSTCPILGLLKSADGPKTGAADTTSYTYHSADDLTGCATTGPCHRKGDLHMVTAPGGLTATYARYDLAGRPTRVLDANGVTTDLEYNLRGWLTARKVRGADNGTEADDAITTLAYDNVGQVTKVTQPDGAFIEFSYDHAHRLTGIEDNLGNTVTYTLDGAGNRIAEETRDAGSVLKHSLSRVYDQLGQLETLADALATPTDFTYDAVGQVDTVTDAFNRTTDNDYDPLGRLKRSIANVGGTGVERAETQFQYDALDNLTAVIDPKGLTTSYGYNGLGDLVTLTSPDTGATTYTYDSAGNRSGQLDARGVQSTYSYDALNRLTGIDLPTAGQDIGFAYDTAPTVCQTGETFAAGRLSGFTDPSGSTAYCYDRRGNVVRKVQSVTGVPDATVGYTHNAADRLVAMTYPSGAIVTYLRDATGRITGVTAKPTAGSAAVTVVSDVDYLPFGPATLMTFGNGRTLDRSFDQNYGIAGITDSAVNGVDLDYTLDAVGNVTGLAERTVSGTTATRTVEYDDLDRLTGLKDGATTVQGFTYDATGNRLSKSTGSTSTYQYPTDSHRLTKVGNTNRSHDAAGNTTVFSTTRTFGYDDRGRLGQVTVSGTLSYTFLYNARGERLVKQHLATPANSKYFVYDEAGRLLGEYRPDGTRYKEYVWLDDTLVAVLGSHAGSSHQYVLTDHLGTPRAVVHPGTNAIQWRWDLTGSAFGDHAAQNDPDGDSVLYSLNLRYPGQYYDAETLLHYNYFRDYDPGTGRYVQSDPIGLAAGTSTYGYAHGNAFTYLDVLGLLCRSGKFIVDAPGSVEYSEVRGTESILKLPIPVVTPQISGVEELADANIRRRSPLPFGFGPNGDIIEVELVRDLLEFYVNTEHHYFEYKICEDECGNESTEFKHVDTTMSKNLVRRAKSIIYSLPPRYLGPETPITFP